jgi:DNA (cytosine-5)-methyltransferase 1
MSGLVLSLFPGIGLLDMAFEVEGFCVVRGPDLLWGGDVRKFHPPAGRFDGVIGGPPCKRFSALANINKAQYGEESLAPNLIPEYERCVSESQPEWFLMENVPKAPSPSVEGYIVKSYLFNNRWFGAVQNRVRRFSFGTRDGLPLLVETQVFEPLKFEPAVTGNNGGRRAVAVKDANGRVRGKQGDSEWHRLRRRSIEEICELQGLQADHLRDAPFTTQSKREVVANGVPIPMGRAIAKAVLEATNI